VEAVWDNDSVCAEGSSIKAAEMAGTLREHQETNAYVNLTGGRVYVKIGKKNERDRSAAEVAQELREKLAQPVGAQNTVMEDLNNNTRKPGRGWHHNRMKPATPSE